MAVKKVKETEKETKVETSVETELEVEVQEDVQETPAVEVSVEENTSDVEVDTEKAEVKEANKPNGGTKIRMRVDHKCTIAMETYNLQAGKTYVVPMNVKRILNNAGLLAPL